MPLQPKFKRMLANISKRVCKGNLKTASEGVPTCKRARNIFWAIMNKRGIKPDVGSHKPKKKVEEVVSLEEWENMDWDALLKWAEEQEW